VGARRAPDDRRATLPLARTLTSAGWRSIGDVPSAPECAVRIEARRSGVRSAARPARRRRRHGREVISLPPLRVGATGRRASRSRRPASRSSRSRRSRCRASRKRACSLMENAGKDLEEDRRRHARARARTPATRRDHREPDRQGLRVAARPRDRPTAGIA
jgi:hypothetical protein